MSADVRVIERSQDHTPPDARAGEERYRYPATEELWEVSCGAVEEREEAPQGVEEGPGGTPEYERYPPLARR